VRKWSIAGTLGGMPLGDNEAVRIMGVLNLSEDSFFTGSVRKGRSAVSSALKMVQDGADCIDVGARSTAPYKKYDIPEETEKKLLVKTIRSLGHKIDVPISVDTTRYQPAKAALEAGAAILNDVYGFTQKDSSKLADLVSSKGASLLTCAHETTPGKSKDVLGRIISCLQKTVRFARLHGIDEKNIAVDPGIGFFKDPRISNLDWNSKAISELQKLRTIRLPVAIGVSRKRFIGRILGKESPEDRLYGSLGATAVAIINGAHIVRTHDVLETSEVTKVVSYLREKRFNPTRD
jgi:dihydropteroate synthase